MQNYEDLKTVFVIIKQAGIFGVFSTLEKAVEYKKSLILDLSVAFYENDLKDVIQIKEFEVT